jgi:hypothetical protein
VFAGDFASKRGFAALAGTKDGGDGAEPKTGLDCVE